ncbi:hypothetical protein N9937_00630 [bacterium]|nr:hypothetical protein [bacterium]
MTDNEKKLRKALEALAESSSKIIATTNPDQQDALSNAFDVLNKTVPEQFINGPVTRMKCSTEIYDDDENNILCVIGSAENADLEWLGDFIRDAINEKLERDEFAITWECKACGYTFTDVPSIVLSCPECGVRGLRKV